MPEAFDKDYWESHWRQADGHAPGGEIAPNPYLAREISDLAPGTALDAGCGEGAEAIWLAAAGWQVTAADISTGALARAAQRARAAAAPDRVQWVEADLSVWEPDERFDLVTTHYAHPAGPQLAFYERVSGWVAPGGTLLIVGHAHGSPDEVLVSAASISTELDTTHWDIITADEPVRTLTNREGRTTQLSDVVVRAIRRD